jgi:hypothetical protein
MNDRAKAMHSISPFKGYEFEKDPKLSISTFSRQDGHRFMVHRGVYTPKQDNVKNYIHLANLRTSSHLLED